MPLPPVVRERYDRSQLYRYQVRRRPDGRFDVAVQHLDDEDTPHMGHIEIWGDIGAPVTADTERDAVRIAERMLREAAKGERSGCASRFTSL
jgi:hypothetical protein